MDADDEVSLVSWEVLGSGSVTDGEGEMPSVMVDVVGVSLHVGITTPCNNDSKGITHKYRGKYLTEFF